MQLIKRSLLRLVASSVCDYIQQPQGAGLTANFIRYNRMTVPVVTLSEGTDPSDNTFSNTAVTVTLDQWGDILTLSDVAQLTTKHPIVQNAIELLSESAARVMDREIQLVWLAGTNVQYVDGSVASRSAIGSSNKVSDTVLHKARVTLIDTGVPPRGGPAGGIFTDGPLTAGSSGMKAVGSGGDAGSVNQGNAYVAFCGPQVLADIAQSGTSIGTWVSFQAYANSKRMYNFEVGTWLGIRFVETNFIPKFTMLGNTTAAVVSTNAFGTDTPVVTAVDGGGTLTSSTGYFFKVTRKDLTRGFEEMISLEHSMTSTATGNNESFTFNFSSLTAGYVYNLYFGATTGDANLKLHTANIAVGTTVTVTAVPSSTTTAPANPATTITVHPIYIFGAEACNWVGIQSFQLFITGDQATTDNPLKLRKKIAYKFMGKAMLRDQTRLLRVEVAASY